MLFSKAYDITQRREDMIGPGIPGLEIFIRVIRRISCQMTAVELGHDPSVTLADGQTFGQKVWPNFVVRLKDSSATMESSVITQGPPMWSTMSVIGRGTHVWKVKQGGKTRVLKTFWRKAGCTPESIIFEKIPTFSLPHPTTGKRVKRCGIARMSCGTTVGSSRGIPISVHNFRKEHGFELGSLDFTLERGLVEPVGKPLW
jgi:hypothetical protein